MSNILYELALEINLYAWFELGVIIVLVLLIKKYTFKTVITLILGKLKFFGFIFLLLFFLDLSVKNIFISLEKMYIWKVYLSEKYDVIQGEVSNFEAGDDMGRYKESFYINGVFFYYRNKELRTGYNVAKCDGGVISGDGQLLKIYYVYSPFYKKGNHIVRIEKLE